MKWYLKAFIQKSLSIIPYGDNINLLLQKQYGELSSIELEDRIKEIIRTFIDPIISTHGKLSNLQITEIGTGWVPVLPITLSFLGSCCKTFDVVKHINHEVFNKTLAEVYNHLDDLAEIPGFQHENSRKKIEQALKCQNLNEALQTIGIHYIAPINTACLPIDSNSQDAVVSRLVLNYIPIDILPEVIKETFRILKHGSIAIHRFGLYDEYASIDSDVTIINFLKYPGWFWNRFVNNRIKYTNQARYPYYLDLFKKAGFEIVSYRKTVDERSLQALSTMKVAKEFRHYSKEELATTGLTVILRKP